MAQRSLCCWQRLRLTPGEVAALDAAQASLDRPTEESLSSQETHEDPLLRPVQTPSFRVTVDRYQRPMQRDNPVIFHMTVRLGDAVWQIRRRYRQLWAVHHSLCEGLRGSDMRGLPLPPPRKTARSVLFGPLDARFLQERARRMELYVQALLDFIPCVEQCEALYNFLCLVNQRRGGLDLLHGEIVGGGAPPVDAAAIAKLPLKRTRKASPSSSSVASARDLDAEEEEGEEAEQGPDLGTPKKAALCVICQEPCDPSDIAGDVRELPCGHEFHYRCIEQWLRRRNTCCVCNGPGVLSAPRLM